MGATRMTTTKVYDHLNRLTSIASVNASAAVLDSHAYAYNTANQRTSVTRADSSHWDFGYDALGQVTSGKKYWSDNVPVAGEQFQYAFDDIGNRTGTDAGGNQFGAALRHAAYSANLLNQYDSRTVPGGVDILGSALSAATVTVNNQPTYRHGDYYRAELTFNNAGDAVYAAVTNVAVLNQGGNPDIIATSVGHLFLPRTPEAFTHDADGNLTLDGRWTYTWDAENRLIQMESRTNTALPPDTNAPPGGGQSFSLQLQQQPPPRLRLRFGYDYQGRRISKSVEQFDGSDWRTNLFHKFVYDGWNLIAELNGTNHALIRSYMWGLDLSGSEQGAGGVGGLLAVSTPTATQFTCYDGNGNIMALIDSSTADLTGQYEYGPFGEHLRVTGDAALDNPFGFSTKYTDTESGLVNFGKRYLNIIIGEWTSDEPLGEAGCFNLHGFVGNDAINSFDVLGLYQEGGHYFTTYIGSQIAGRSDLALALAFYSELPDELKELTAFDSIGETGGKAVKNLLTSGAFDPGFDAIQRYLHSLDGGLAQPRRDCLRKLLQGQKLQTWERGLLIHAFGDSYAHSYIDKAPVVKVTSPLGSWDTVNNPFYNQEVLYEAPFGHGTAGTAPDIMSRRPELYGRYLTDLVTTLNGKPLTASQMQRIDSVVQAVKGFPQGISGEVESSMFRNVALSYGYPADGYRPDKFGPLSRQDFLDGPGKELGFKLPTDADIRSLLEKIKEACCGK